MRKGKDYSVEEIIEEITKIKNSIGRFPTQAELRKESFYSYDMFFPYGGFNNFLEKYFNHEKHKILKRKYTDQELKDHYFTVKKALEINERPLKYFEISNFRLNGYFKINHLTYCRHFGSWKETLRKFGENPDLHQKIKDQKKIDELKFEIDRLKNALGRYPTVSDFKKESPVFATGTPRPKNRLKM